MNEPSKQLVNQRVRNGIILYLETASDEAEQRRYQRSVPYVNVGNEMINQWEDWVRLDLFDTYCEPVFSVEEQAAMCAYQSVWEAVAASTPDPLPDSIEDTLGLKQWPLLMEAARNALAVFMKRGLFDSEVEEKF
jgi:hypothetical protein